VAPTITSKAREVVDRTKLPPFVVDRRVELDVDSTGETAVWIWIIVADDTELAADDVSSLRNALRAELRRADVELWPYVRIRTRSEQAKLDEE